MQRLHRNAVRKGEGPRLTPQLGFWQALAVALGAMLGAGLLANLVVGLSLPWQTLAVVGAVAAVGLGYYALLRRVHRH